MNKAAPIGIFDSGVGGLTVAKEIKRILPNESIIYFGDTKHVPYGDKSQETVTKYAKHITEFLLESGCKAIIIACNTASANAFEEVSTACEGKALLFDVITPVAEKVAFELNQNIGVIATKATVRSGIYKKKIRQFNKHLKVIELATPLLAPIIEEGFIKTAVSKAAIDSYLSNVRLKEIDSLILGCTHYPLIESEIDQFYDNRINIIDSPLIVANTVYHQLQKKNLLQEEEGKATYRFYISDYTKSFSKMAKKFFGNEISLELQELD